MLQKFSSLVSKLPVGIRTVASAKKEENNDLVTILHKELKLQNQQASEENSMDEALKTMTKMGFNQVSSKNLLSVCMQKKVKDKTITIYSDFNMIMNRPPDMEDEEAKAPAKEKGTEEESQPIDTMVGYIATLGKENDSKGLIVELIVNDTGIEVGGVRHTNELNKDTKFIMENGKAPEDLYGPSFDRLDERLQTGMTDYFVSLGINEEALSTMFDILNKKEEKLYSEWLHKISEFVA